MGKIPPTPKQKIKRTPPGGRHNEMLQPCGDDDGEKVEPRKQETRKQPLSSSHSKVGHKRLKKMERKNRKDLREVLFNSKNLFVPKCIEFEAK